MADRFVVGDTVTLTNAFAVDGTATDPTTITLVVTDPSGNADTYTYAGATITKSSTGVYTKNITADEAGIWSYTWTGTGTAADVADGTFEVHANQPLAANSADVLTMVEAKRILNLDMTSNTHDEWVAVIVTAVSQQLDELCGPVVQRTVTSEAHDGGDATVRLKYRPVASVTTVTEYDGTAATTLTAETNTTKTASNYFVELTEGLIRRRSSGSDTVFPAGRGNVLVTYEAGRAANTAAVAPKFKQAAAMMLRNLWVSEAASGSETVGAFTEFPVNPLLGPGMLNKVAALLHGEMKAPWV